MRILAHRGFWQTPDEKNTRSAFGAAFEAGWGVELDVRDQGGDLVIAHDLPIGPCLPFQTVLDDYVASGCRGTIAINIKADGLATKLADTMKGLDLGDRTFVFDMSVPDLMTFLGSGIPVFHRRSEVEPASKLDGTTDGIWLDFFRGRWADPSVMIEQLWLGGTVAVVSPELHRQPHRPGWAAMQAAIQRSGLPAEAIADRLMLCTDLPTEAVSFFGLASPRMVR